MKSTGERLIPGDSGEVELEHLNRYFFVINQLALKDKVVIDLASGEGYGSNLMSHHAAQVYGIDISEEAVTHAKNKYKSANLQFIQGSADKIPLEDAIADVFVSFETIEHHELHQEMMQEIKRVLKPNGILIISSPDKHYYSDVLNFKNDYHVKELYYREFKQLMDQFFKNNFFFLQRTFSGSMIIQEEPSIVKQDFPIIYEPDGSSYMLTPLYHIAICTDNSSFNVNNSMVFYKESGNMLTYADILAAKDMVRMSKTYRAGSTLTKSLKWIKSKLKK